MLHITVFYSYPCYIHPLSAFRDHDGPNLIVVGSSWCSSTVPKRTWFLQSLGSFCFQTQMMTFSMWQYQKKKGGPVYHRCSLIPSIWGGNKWLCSSTNVQQRKTDAISNLSYRLSCHELHIQQKSDQKHLESAFTASLQRKFNPWCKFFFYQLL